MSSDPEIQPLRVGLILDRPRTPRWVQQSIRAIQALAGAQIVLLIWRGGPPGSGGHPGSLRERWRRFGYDAFVRIDTRLFRGRPDLFEPIDLGGLLSDCPALRLHGSNDPGEDDPSEADREAIRRHRLDVLVDLGSTPRRFRGEGNLARLGRWSLCHGATPFFAARPAGFREVVDGTQPLYTALVAAGGEANSPRRLIETWSPVDRRSVRRTLERSLPKLSLLPARALGEEIRRGGEPAAPVGIESAFLSDGIIPEPPGNGEVGAAAAILAARYAGDRLRRLVRRERWRLAYGFDCDRLSPRPDRFLVPPPGHFWADPFPIADETGYWIFFEAAPIANPVGSISVMRMERSGRCAGPEPALESKSHLSYPAVFQAGGQWYLVPESSEAGSVQLFRARRFPFDWELQEVLLDGVRAYDPTLVEIGGRWWMFVNLALEGGSSWDELHLFHADRPQGPWKAHPRNPIKSDARAARPAGRIFEHQGSLYRPGQDCAAGYGRAVALHRIVRIDLREYVEIETGRILPDWSPHLVGVHTLNHAGALTVMDCIAREPRWGWPAAGSATAAPTGRP